MADPNLDEDERSMLVSADAALRYFRRSDLVWGWSDCLHTASRQATLIVSPERPYHHSPAIPLRSLSRRGVKWIGRAVISGTRDQRGERGNEDVDESRK